MSGSREDTAFSRWETLGPPTHEPGLISTSVNTTVVNDNSSMPTAAPGAGAGPSMPPFSPDLERLSGVPSRSRKQDRYLLRPDHKTPSPAGAVQTSSITSTSITAPAPRTIKEGVVPLAGGTFFDADSVLNRLAGRTKQATGVAEISTTALPRTALTAAGGSDEIFFGTGMGAGVGMREAKHAPRNGFECAGRIADTSVAGSISAADCGGQHEGVVDPPSCLGRQHLTAFPVTHALHQGATKEVPKCVTSSFDRVLGHALDMAGDEHDESVVAAGRSADGAGGSRLADLCRQDKAKVARLLQASLTRDKITRLPDMVWLMAKATASS